jgi:uncharacterized membrane protein (UPF0127 family)
VNRRVAGAFIFLAVFFCVAVLSAGTTKVKLQGKRSFTVLAEVADTEALRNQGLMYRTSMRENEGMLFIFEKAGTYQFWMRNTFLPLTIVFIDQSWRVVGIQNMEPLDESKRYAPQKPFLYALEICRGVTPRIGLKEGDRVSFSNTGRKK